MTTKTIVISRSILHESARGQLCSRCGCVRVQLKRDRYIPGPYLDELDMVVPFMPNLVRAPPVFAA